MVPRLLLITPPNSNVEQVEALSESAADTVDLLLLRWPGLSTRQLAARIERLLRSERRPRIAVHARFDLMLAYDLDGVHLPERGLAPWIVRPHAGHRCVGVSRHDAAGLAASRDADYATLSPFASTPSKPGTPPIVPAEFTLLCRRSPVPVLALGGICAANAAAAIRGGARGVATMRGVFDHPDPVASLAELRRIVDEACAG